MTAELTERRAEVDAIFAAIDSFDVDALVARFAANGTQRFGNQDPLRGHDAIAEANRAFLGSLDSIKHKVIRVVSEGRTTVVELQVTYCVGGRPPVTIPAVSAYDSDDDGLITDYRVYFDLAPVFGEA